MMMTTQRSCLLCLLLVAGAAPAMVAAQQASGDTFVGLRAFLSAVTAAQPEAYMARPASKVRTSAAFEEMRRHVLTMYEGVQSKHGFVLDSQYFDCIPIEQQPSLRLRKLKLAALPPARLASQAPSAQGKAPGAPSRVEPQGRLGLVDKFGNKIACQAGTIPFRRLTLEEMSRFETLQQFFQKAPGGDAVPMPPRSAPGATPPVARLAAPATHKYAFAYQFVDNLGGNSWLNLWSPAINTGAGQIFSLSQHWYASADGTQTVEGGWQAYPGKYGTTKSALFIYWTADGYSTTGCYNLDCAAFVQINPNWFLGGTFSNYSTPGGPQYEFELQWQLYKGNWFLFLAGGSGYQLVGYYPGSIYNGGQLASGAALIEYGGETVGTTSWPPMGSGAFANQGFGFAAYQRLIFYITGSGSQWADLTAVEPSPSCYTIIVTPAASGGSWGTYFFFGGPGGNSC
ncbi:MAG TPA: neprosin family prolyl endopeptidase [Thermoanaerobaculia bacterium]|nr:neprosin family prolyl endopeptidase [Thermoanaerobaculia bacterium]